MLPTVAANGIHAIALEPWYFWISKIARFLFAPKRYALVLASPLCWDNEDDPILQDESRAIIDRIERALRKRYKRFAVEFEKD